MNLNFHLEKTDNSRFRSIVFLSRHLSWLHVGSSFGACRALLCSTSILCHSPLLVRYCLLHAGIHADDSPPYRLLWIEWSLPSLRCAGDARCRGCSSFASGDRLSGVYKLYMYCDVVEWAISYEWVPFCNAVSGSYSPLARTVKSSMQPCRIYAFIHDPS